MGTKWKSSKFPGVRYREHASRKHGVQKDKYFAVRYQRDGKRKEEGLGWASQGWTVNKAALILAELKEAHVTGNGPTRLSEKREFAEAEKNDKLSGSITYSDFFEQTYFPNSKSNKSWRSYSREEQFYRIWISPVIGNKSLPKVSPLDLERIKRNMVKAGRSPRTIHYCLATIRQVFNSAKLLDIYKGENPVSKVKKPKVDNKRLRFLTRDETDRLLDNLKLRSDQLYNMALISLHTGLRAGEIFNLIWADVDAERGILMVRDPKGVKNRAAFMTSEVKNMFSSFERGNKSDLVFTDRNGNLIKEISNAFGRAVKTLGLNEGVDDRRYLVTFHTLRHTFASWLVQNGTDLYTVKELLGHSTLAMTERYSHLSNGKLQQAVQDLEKSMSRDKNKSNHERPNDEETQLA